MQRFSDSDDASVPLAEVEDSNRVSLEEENIRTGVSELGAVETPGRSGSVRVLHVGSALLSVFAILLILTKCAGNTHSLKGRKIAGRQLAGRDGRHMKDRMVDEIVQLCLELEEDHPDIFQPSETVQPIQPAPPPSGDASPELQKTQPGAGMQPISVTQPSAVTQPGAVTQQRAVMQPSPVMQPNPVVQPRAAMDSSVEDAWLSGWGVVPDVSSDVSQSPHVPATSREYGYLGGVPGAGEGLGSPDEGPSTSAWGSNSMVPSAGGVVNPDPSEPNYSFLPRGEETSSPLDSGERGAHLMASQPQPEPQTGSLTQLVQPSTQDGIPTGIPMAFAGRKRKFEEIATSVSSISADGLDRLPASERRMMYEAIRGWTTRSTRQQSSGAPLIRAMLQASGRSSAVQASDGGDNSAQLSAILRDSSRDHPFYKTPTLQQGVTWRPFSLDVARACNPRVHSIDFNLRYMRTLLLQDAIQQNEMKGFINKMEVIAGYLLEFHCKSVLSATPRDAARHLGVRYLILDTLYAATEVLGKPGNANSWWAELVKNIPCEVAEYDCERSLGPQFLANVKTARELSVALQKLKLGVRPSSLETVRLKRMLFCEDTSPPFFRSRNWDPWRQDNNRWLGRGHRK